MFKKTYLDYDFTKILEADYTQQHDKYTLQVSGFFIK
jgi:hypothetical protein